MNKILGIGLHRTGTTNLGNALRSLGYDVCGHEPSLLEPIQQGQLNPVFDLVDQDQAFRYTPWPQLSKELDILPLTLINRCKDGACMADRRRRAWCVDSLGYPPTCPRRFGLPTAPPRGRGPLGPHWRCRAEHVALAMHSARRLGRAPRGTRLSTDLFGVSGIRYPGSKFILTIRDPLTWYRSMLKVFSNRSAPMRKWIYGFGAPLGHNAAYLRVYQQRKQEVLAYFADRPTERLVVDWEEQTSWDIVCDFLDKPVPDLPFPHEGKREIARFSRRPLKRFFLWITRRIKRLLYCAEGRSKS